VGTNAESPVRRRQETPPPSTTTTVAAAGVHETCAVACAKMQTKCAQCVSCARGFRRPDVTKPILSIYLSISLSLSLSVSLPLHFVLPLVKILGRELYDTSLAISL